MADDNDPTTLPSPDSTIPEVSVSNGEKAPYPIDTVKRKAPHQKQGRRITLPAYEAMWALYRDGIRNIAEIARRVNYHRSTVQHTIDLGYPQLQLKPLKLRLIEFEGDIKQRKDKIAVENAFNVVAAVQKMRQESMQLSSATRGGLARLLKKLLEQVETATFEKVRRVKDDEGNWITVRLPANAHEMAETLEKMATSLQILCEHDMKWIDDDDLRKQIIGVVRKVGTITEDQLNYIVEHGGDLPPGMSPEQFFNAQLVMPSDGSNDGN